MNIGTPELLIVLVIVVLLFGAGRISKLGGDLGVAIREFRRGLEGAGQPSTEPPTAESASQDKPTE